MRTFKKLLLILTVLTLTFAVSLSTFSCKKDLLEGEKQIVCYVANNESADIFCYILINDANVDNLKESDYKKYSCTTFATDLKAVFDALRDNTKFTYEASYSDYGAFVTSICGFSQDEDNGKYLMFDINGEYSVTGISSTILTDNTVYSFYISSF